MANHVMVPISICQIIPIFFLVFKLEEMYQVLWNNPHSFLIGFMPMN